MHRVLFLALSALTLSAQHTPENEKNPLAGQPEAVAAGQKLFGQACQACHGGNAAGSERGPALSTGVFRRGAKDGEIFLNIRNGIKGTPMPPFGGLPVEQAWQLVSYLRSLSGNVQTNSEKVPGDPAQGEKVFFGKANCAGCHEVSGRGGIIGPDLSNAAALSGQALRDQITQPKSEAGSITLTSKDGRNIQGLPRHEDTFSLVLMDTAGKLHRLDKTAIATRRDDKASLMPTGYAAKLSTTELQDLVAYLKSLNGRDYAKTAAVTIPGGLTYERIRNSAAEPHNWLTYWGDYSGRHFSALKQITPANVTRLQLKWAAQMPGDAVLQTTPIVVDGIMYTSGMPGQVFAYDARTGGLIWKYQRPQKTVNPFESNRSNRGVAVLGNRVYVGTLDAVLIALDARTGRPLWEQQVASTMEGYSITAAPLAVKDKILVGVAGGEHGIRGFVDAYDAATGQRAWRFYTVPAPGEFGGESWKGDSWQRGGAGTWLTGSYDPELDTVYWATGNPGPDMDGEVRKGDNLFSCSVVALNPATGQRKWHYQFTPNDTHDWDANQDLVLTDRIIDGKPRKLLVQTNRNGMFYVLDRTNGQLILGKPYVRQTWNTGFTAGGRPKVISDSDSTPEGRVVYPTLVGGTNWQSPSFDASTHRLYVVYNDGAQRFVREPSVYEPGKAYWGGRALPAGEKPQAGIKAIDTVTGETKWDYKLAQGSLAAGVLATSSGVLFSATAEGNLIALEAATGRYLTRIQTGAGTFASPISYAVDGKQYVAIAAGMTLYTFALPD